MPGKTQVAALINGQATTHDEKLAKDRLVRNLNKNMPDDQAGEGILDYLKKPDGDAIILVVSVQPHGKNQLFKRAAIGTGLKTTDSGIIVPTHCIDEKHSQISIDAVSNKAAQLQLTNHGTDLDGFYIVRAMKNERDHDAAVMREFEHLTTEVGFRKNDSRHAEGEIKDQLFDLLPAGTNWTRQLMIAAADGELTEKLAKDHVRMLENNAEIAARLGQRGAIGPGALVEFVGGGVRLLRDIAAITLLGIRNTVDEIKPDGVKLRKLNQSEKAVFDRVMMGKMNDIDIKADNDNGDDDDRAA